jgi:hypothetical protein
MIPCFFKSHDHYFLFRWALYLNCFICAAWFPTQALADKFDLSLGYYQISAKSSTDTAEFSKLGRYSLNYKKNLTDQVDFVAGYSFYFIGASSSDLGYGLNLGFHFFPLTESSISSQTLQTATIGSSPLVRPYIGIGFHQRQYQSIASGYAGASFALGSEWQIWPQAYLFSEARLLSLRGPLESKVSQLSFDFGIGRNL